VFPKVSNPEEEPATIEETEMNPTLADWPELKGVPIKELFSNGWKPRIKTNHSLRYITIRLQKKNEDGNWYTEEKGLGAFDPDRWQALEEVYWSYFGKSSAPKNDSQGMFPKKKAKADGEGFLGTKIAKPVPSTIRLTLDTLNWYRWAQQQGYKGTMDDFINESVNGYFRDYQKLELAVVIEREED